MTVYGWKHTLDDSIVTVVVAGNFAAQFDAFADKVANLTSDTFVEARLTTPIEHLFTDDLKKFRRKLLIVEHNSEEQRDRFFDELGLVEVLSAPALDKHNTMIAEELEEKKPEALKKREREATIGELTGTNIYDPWDNESSSETVVAPKGITGQSGQGGTAGKLKKGEEEDKKKNLAVTDVNVDRAGNVDMNITVLSQADKDRIADLTAKAEAARKEKEEEARAKIIGAGVNPDEPNTHSSVDNHTGEVHQINHQTKVITTVSVRGVKSYRDAENGLILDEKELRRRVLQAELDELNADNKEEPKQEAQPEPEKATVARRVDPQTGEILEDAPEGEKDTEEGSGKGFTGIGKRGKQASPTPDEKKGPKPEDYYFAVIPPGFKGDPDMPILGQISYIVVMPKEDFNNGVSPSDKGGWFEQELLDKWGWTEIENSVFEIHAKIGTVVHGILDLGAVENGKLLTVMGADLSEISFDWPYQYHKSGRRKTKNDLYVEACRILKIARDQGLKLVDEQGEVTLGIAGVKEEDVSEPQLDVTEELKKMLGAEGKSDKS